MSARTCLQSPRARAGLAAVAFALLAPARPARAQTATAKLGSTVFYEPSRTSKMTVLSPSADVSVSPWTFLSVDAGYSADIVTGASEAVKAGPITSVDVVSSATHLSDFRHIVHGGFTITRESTHLGASYSYGTEHDYRSNAITVTAGTDFLQKNTQIELSYGHGFDSVCNSAYSPTLAAVYRPRLDSSAGCFNGAENRQTMPLALDNSQVAWSQSWTPVLATQLSLTGAVQHGFLGNPYRAVVIGAGGQEAQEHHPDNRARGAVSLALKYYVRPLETAFTLSARGYRDTWDVVGQTYELDAEHYVLPWMRVLVRGRYYTQTGALFWSDDYTGGEPKYGPRGQYWTGDRELSPLWNFLVGGRLLMSWEGRTDARLAGALLGFDASVSADLMKTYLDEFTWGGKHADDTLALIAGVSLGGVF
ncbi:MAG: DUF3570 domain-containing protein [Sorangiineae bacterium]|nr:DUF3570 domain-containing protein [Polyangiaceae bacterium]MEB2322278.1 DUF3570 domain-containing protein [Sorangiineae bacterium]